MKTKLFTGMIAATIAATAVVVPPALNLEPAQAQATSLAGSKGNVKRRLPRGQGACPDAVKEYIKASGHSAYASTSINDFNATNYICGSAINRKSVKEAETLALRACENGTKKWKYAYKGKCEIHASK